MANGDRELLGAGAAGTDSGCGEAAALNILDCLNKRPSSTAPKARHSVAAAVRPWIEIKKRYQDPLGPALFACRDVLN